MTRTARALRRLALTLGTGYVLFFFSERVFWSLWRPGDEGVVYVATWLLYSLFAYLLLATIRFFAVRPGLPLFLAGALFGWLTEGVYAMTLFGVGGLPFPITVAWTGLAWHALLAVTIGWFALRRALQATSPWPSLGLALAIGSFWGFWAVAWGRETPPVTATPGEFLAHAAATTALLALAHRLIDWGAAADFRPTRIGLALTAGPVLAFFVLVTVPTVPWSPAVIGPLFAIVVLALRRAGHHGPDAPAAQPDALAVLAAPVRAANLAALALVPAAAALVYVGLRRIDLVPPSHQIVLVVTSTIGIGLFGLALVRLLRRGRAGASAAPGIPGNAR